MSLCSDCVAIAWMSLTLPCNSWPLVLVSVYAASVFGPSYVNLTTILFVFPDRYGFNPEYVGLVYLGVAVGMAAGTLFCGLILDRLLRRAKERGDGGPEARLQATVLAVILVPAGLLLYGWPSEYRLHWIVPIIGIAIKSMGLAIANVTSLNYVVDAFGIYAASASTILSVSRYVVATLLPLAAPPLVSAIGNGWTNTALGGIALVTAPIPFVLVRYGKGMRERGQLRVDAF